MPRLDIAMSIDEALEFLASSRTGVLATIGARGFPHLAAMRYVLVAGGIEFVTYRKAQKAVNIARNPRAAFLIGSGENYTSLRGVRVEGNAVLRDDPERVLAIRLEQLKRYPEDGIEETPETRPAIERQAAKQIVVSLPIERMSSWDNRRVP
jgi:nitroimidazol reductase NimA-like FMN-containing flavoprotein (pyridoxamine 5'-phosphate oxidase superfamily)